MELQRGFTTWNLSRPIAVRLCHVEMLDAGSPCSEHRGERGGGGATAAVRRRLGVPRVRDGCRSTGGPRVERSRLATAALCRMERRQVSIRGGACRGDEG